jgi:hypothetical protein
MAYALTARGWSRTRRWTGGFSADCTVPSARLVMGSMRKMSRITSGAYRGTWVNTEGMGMTVEAV